MRLNEATLKELRKLINEKSKYRSGPELVEYFNDLGFSDIYGKGFPSRWYYTDEKLNIINGSPEIIKCIENLFSPNQYIGKHSYLDQLIDDFNQYISYDGWIIQRDDRVIKFNKTERIHEKKSITEISEIEFLRYDFGEIDITKLNFETAISTVLTNRVKELQILIEGKAYLSSIISMGSLLEGVLLAIATKNPMIYNKSKSSPKDKDGAVKKLFNWSLNDLIDVTYELDIFKEDVFKFASILRYFRNYIHPFQQMSSGFTPTEETVCICYQVLKAAITQIEQFVLSNR